MSGHGGPRLDAETIALMTSLDAFEEHTFEAGHKYTAVEFVARGETGFVWRVKDRYGRERAAKFTPIEFTDEADPRREFDLRQALPSPLFTRAEDFDMWTHSATGKRFQVIVEEWVADASTLEDFVRFHPDRIDINTVVGLVRHLSSALDALAANGLAHDDLHWRNILVRDSLPGEVNYSPTANTLQLVIVDTGSLKLIQDTHKPWTDYNHLAHHLAHMHNVMHARRDLTASDREFLGELREIMPMLIEEDADRGIRTGKELRNHIDEAYERVRFGGPRRTRALTNPFEFISAEQISSDSLLLDLFATTSWLEQVTSGDPVLLTGPRGCGKSMVLRWMSLRAHAEQRDKEVPLTSLNVAGIYVSCTADFQNRFAEIQTEADLEATRHEVIHYFNLIHARELVATLMAIAARDDAETVFGLGDSAAASIAAFFAAHIHEPDGASFENLPLRSAASSLERAIFESQKRLHTHAAPEKTLTSISFLGDLTSALVRAVPFFDKHRIAFLLDDFSLHRLSEHVQRALIPIVWERRSSHMFKVSSEKHGIVDDYQGGELTIDLTRERIEVDAGSEFVSATPERNLEFATQLLANRLKAAEWSGTPEQLIGGSPSMKAIAEKLADPTQSNDRTYYGLGTIANLCSGDVATLLYVFRHVLAGSTSTSKDQVPTNKQHTAIIGVSREMLQSLMHHRPLGKQLHTHSEAFGQFARRMLVDTATQSGGGKPVQIPRIEIDGDSAALQTLTTEQQRLRKELLRRAVYISIQPGRSRHNMVTTTRWHLRRIFLPAFLAGLGKDEAVKATASEFGEFLDGPQEFLDGWRKRRRTHEEPAAQLDLWGEQE